jgi:hypothetical protein
MEIRAGVDKQDASIDLTHGRLNERTIGRRVTVCRLEANALKQV